MALAPPSQQATRHARRVYVGGLPPTANEQNIATFMSNALAAIGGQTAGVGEAFFQYTKTAEVSLPVFLMQLGCLPARRQRETQKGWQGISACLCLASWPQYNFYQGCQTKWSFPFPSASFPMKLAAERRTHPSADKRDSKQRPEPCHRLWTLQHGDGMQTRPQVCCAQGQGPTGRIGTLNLQENRAPTERRQATTSPATPCGIRTTSSLG